MDEITLDDKTYVSSKRAAQITGYAKDYVGQLCREGRVAARLVGRNWYVLEDSIREHRFGTEAHVAATGMPTEPVSTTENPVSAASDTQNASESTWQSPNYTTDTAPELIPTLNSAEKKYGINALETHTSKDELGNVISDSAHSSAVKEMQSAWHDWFVRTNELAVSEEILLEEPENPVVEAEIPVTVTRKIDELTSEDLARQRFDDFNTMVESSRSYSSPVAAQEKEEVVPVSLEKVSEVIEKGSMESADSFGSEEMIPIHRTESISVTSSQKRAAQRSAPPVYSRVELRSDVFTHKDEPEGRIIRERRVMPKGKPSLILQVLFLCIAGLAIIITIIGSGKLTSLISSGHANYAPIQYLGGERSIINSNK